MFAVVHNTHELIVRMCCTLAVRCQILVFLLIVHLPPCTTQSQHKTPDSSWRRQSYIWLWIISRCFYIFTNRNVWFSLSLCSVSVSPLELRTIHVISTWINCKAQCKVRRRRRSSTKTCTLTVFVLILRLQNTWRWLSGRGAVSVKRTPARFL